MTKPTPIEEWIDEKWPENEFDPVVDFDDYILNSTSRQAARETAHYILEELGVRECLEYLREELNAFPDRSGGYYGCDCKEELNYILDDGNRKWIEETLTKLRGEPQ